MQRVLLPILFWLICRFPTGRGKITRGQRGFFLLLLLIIELLYQAAQIQRMICIKHVKTMSENAPKSHSSLCLLAACVVVLCWANESSGAVVFCPPGSPGSPPRPLLVFLPSPRGTMPRLVSGGICSHQT